MRETFAVVGKHTRSFGHTYARVRNLLSGGASKAAKASKSSILLKEKSLPPPPATGS
jgi:hypothetical protein